MFPRKHLWFFALTAALALLFILRKFPSSIHPELQPTAQKDTPTNQTPVHPESQTISSAAQPPLDNKAPAMPAAISDPALTLSGLVGVSLEIGPGKSATLTLTPSELLVNKGVTLVQATALIISADAEPIPVSVMQPYVGAPITIALIGTLTQLGKGHIESLVGGVPLFLEITATDSASQVHVSRIPFEVTTRDLQAEANAVAEPPPLLSDVPRL